MVFSFYGLNLSALNFGDFSCDHKRDARARFLKEQANQRAEQERLLKEQEQLKYQTLLSQLKAKGIDITTLE